MRLNLTNSQFIIKEDGMHYMKTCRGCRTYEDEMSSLPDYQKREYVYLCNVSISFKGGEVCPCSICIVKMVCNMRCKTLSDYLHKLPRFEEGHKK